MTFMQALIYGLPWWVQALAGAGLVATALIFIARLAGFAAALRFAVVAFALFGALVYGRRERQLGWSDRKAQETRDAQQAIERARRARAAADASFDGLRDDGFRRD